MTFVLFADAIMLRWYIWTKTEVGFVRIVMKKGGVKEHGNISDNNCNDMRDVVSSCIDRQ